LQGNAVVGRGIVINASQGNQTVQNCRIINFAPGATMGAVDYTSTTAGSRSIFIDCEVWQTGGTSGTGLYAFRTPDGVQAAAVPKTFMGIQTSGFCSFYFGGANDNFITNSFLADLAFTANTRGVNVECCRISNQSALALDGHNNSLICCDINPTLTINSGADNITIGPGSFNSLPITDSSGNARNNVTHWLTSYTPAVSGWTKANGTITGEYCRQGATITATVNYTVGSTDTISGTLAFSLPVARVNSSIVQLGVAVITHSGTQYMGAVQISGAASTCSLLAGASGTIAPVTGSAPVSFATGDTFRLTFTYSL
jgi:hypothetical protein